MKKYFILFTCLALLTGCAGLADSMGKMAGLGVISVEKSTFDGSKTIKVSPTFLYESKDDWTAKSVKLGARWSNASPNFIALDLAYDSSTGGYGAAYLSITGIDVNIDGKKSSYSTGKRTSLNNSGYNTVSKTIYTKSENSVVIPFSVLESMVNAKDCRIRIHTSKGYEDAIFSIERSTSGQGAALLSIREFLDKVRAEKKLPRS